MPITFKIAPHDANPLDDSCILQNPTAQNVLTAAWDSQTVKCQYLLQSSWKSNQNFVADQNGFVNNVVRAYNRHHNLVLRPDDIWIAILCQFGLFVNRHAEELRSSFVAHEGKKELYIEMGGYGFGRLAQQFGQRLAENIVDPSLHQWVIPSFTTTTNNDRVVCSIIMMSTLKAYFSYTGGICCGIPSITLLGDKADYVAIQQKLEKLQEFGVEPAAFASLLGPVLGQFVLAFDAVEKGQAPNPSFWRKMCHYKDFGSGGQRLGGWITAFCVWDEDGNWQGVPLDRLVVSPLEEARENELDDNCYRPLVFQGFRYPTMDTTSVPVGYSEVDVKIDDDGKEIDCMMVAGHVGAVVTGAEGKRDTLQPAAEWFMFEKGQQIVGF